MRNKTRFLPDWMIIASILAMCMLSLFVINAEPANGAQSKAGLQDGWPADPTTDEVWLTEGAAKEMAGSGAHWIRLHFRLGEHAAWDPKILSVYDEIVGNCRKAGLQIIGLINNESWYGSQPEWTENNAERLGGNGRNPYVENYAKNAVAVLAKRYYADSRVLYWEIWNEPDVWTQINPKDVGEDRNAIGGSYMYPSNYAWMLRLSYEVLKTNKLSKAKIISGGLLAADFHGTADDSGRDYLTATYEQGKALAGWDAIKKKYRSYPVNGWGQHMYICGGCRLDNPDLVKGPPYLSGGALYKFYLDALYDAVVKIDGNTHKKVFITEWGWVSPSMSEEDQAANIGLAMDVFQATPYIAAVTYFTLHDVPPADLFYGLKKTDGTPKLAWKTFNEKSKAMNGN